MTQAATIRDLDRSQMEALIRARAAQDADFRAGLLKDPHAALLAAFGARPDPDYAIRVVEEKAGEVFFVLPAAMLGDGELTDAALAGASGGLGISPDITDAVTRSNVKMPGQSFLPNLSYGRGFWLP